MDYKDITQPIQAGFNNSDIGIAFNRSMPRPEEYERLSPFKKAIAAGASMVSDSPVYMLGGLLGAVAGGAGAPIGALGLQRGYRQYLNELYGNDENRNTDIISRGARVGRESLYGAGEGLATQKAAQLLGSFAPLVLNKIVNKRVPTVNVTDDMLIKLENNLPNGINNPFYKFVQDNRKWIEMKPQMESNAERYINNKFGVNNLDTAVKVKSPIEDINITPEYLQKLVNHPRDIHRNEFVPEALATLERPNQIVKDAQGRNNYFKLFYDGKFKPHLSGVSQKADETFFNTSFPLQGRNITKRIAGDTIYQKKDAPRWVTPRASTQYIVNNSKRINETMRKLLGSFYKKYKK
ncbi:MAG: hypothetical protein LBV16_06955 [Elusimicrobiota bacterium]|jgi:hypothetical protein|nr:hypothetical protein [Elusimicrobiota bacterium]